MNLSISKATFRSLGVLASLLVLVTMVAGALQVPNSMGSAAVRAGVYLPPSRGQLVEKAADKPWPDKPPYPNPFWYPRPGVDAVAFGNDVRVSTSTPNMPHNETFVASDPNNSLHFTTASNEYAAGRGLGFWYTLDGGTTWGGGSVPGPYPDGQSIQPQADASGDIDALGNTYYASLGFSYSETCSGGVYVHRSTDGGQTIGTPVRASAASSNSFLDKDWIAVNKQTSGPYAGRVYVVYSRLVVGEGCNMGQFSGLQGELVYSTDHGATWSQPLVLPQPDSPVRLAEGLQVISAQDGVVYVAYNYGTGGLPYDQSLYVTRSTDGGQTFGDYHAMAPGPLAPLGYPYSDGKEYLKADDAGHAFRALQLPVLAVDPTNPDTLYATWAYHQNGWDTTYTAKCCRGSSTVQTFNAADIAFSRSTDGGQTWTAPTRVNDDPLNNGRDQFMPWMVAVGDGNLHIAWYDRRDDPTNVLYNLYYSVSTDGGHTWGANTRVSDVSSDPGRVLYPPGDAFVGDYSGIAVSTERALAVWSDMRPGPVTQNNIYTDPDMLGGGGTPTPSVVPTASETGVVTATPQATSTHTTVVIATSTATNTIASTATAQATSTSATTSVISVTPVSSPTSTTCPIEFSDVPADSTLYSYVRCLACRGVLGGYGDGTFRPGNNITRGQIAKVVSNAARLQEPVSGESYTDVPATHPFYGWIERLTARGIMSGYPCGGEAEPCDGENHPYFRPFAQATRGQLAKIVSNAAGFSEPAEGQFYADVSPSNPFYNEITRLTSRGVMSGYLCGGPGEPCDAESRPYFRWGNPVTRGQASKIVSNTFFPNCQTPSRYWTGEGLFAPVSQTLSGYALYDSLIVERAKEIRHLQRQDRRTIVKIRNVLGTTGAHGPYSA